jgi:hypothetical protein
MVFSLPRPKNPDIKNEVQKNLGYTIQGINSTINRNIWNGIMTSEVVLEVLEKELKMSRSDRQELEKEEVYRG